MMTLKKEGEIDALRWPRVPPTQAIEVMRDPNIKTLTTGRVNTSH